MSLSKKQIKSRSQKEPKFAKKAVILETESADSERFTPLFLAKLNGDNRGWYRHFEMIAHENGTWSNKLIGKTLIDIKDYDCNLVVKMNYTSYKKSIEIPLCILSDLSTAFQSYNRMSRNRLAGRKKIKKNKKEGG